jgi:NAD(P)-dependent dehydrogenase (short-subunit alcohol dehydrogenase family)
MKVALITGASRGLGHALARAMAHDGWSVVADARDEPALREAFAHVHGDVTLVPGDVSDADHRAMLASVVHGKGGLDVLVNNASTLGPSPLPPLHRYPLADLEDVLRTNTVAPLALIQLLLPDLAKAHGAVVNVTSDAAVEAYPGWGGYGASKAALDQLTNVLGAEHDDVRFYAFDPGDMRTRMHQDAFPGEDISDRPEPQTVVPSLLRLVEERPPSGRYRAADLLATGARS